MSRARLDRRVQFLRASRVDDGYQGKQAWSNHGSKVWAAKEDRGGNEGVVAGGVSAVATTVWIVRFSEFTRALTAKDALQYRGVTHEILDIDDVGRDHFLKITTGAEVSNGVG